MSMRIGKVRLHNFGPFEDAEVDFSLPGITLVEGIINGRPGCSSNGAAKSMLAIDSIMWCLFGRCMRPNYAGDQVIRHEEVDGVLLPVDEGCFVEVNVIGGELPIVATRYRKFGEFGDQAVVSIGDEDVSKGTNPATDALIEQLLGMDFDTACNTIAYGAREDVKSFFAADDVTRKKTFDTILQLDDYAQAEAVAKAEWKMLTEQDADLASKAIQARASAVERREALAQLASDGGAGALEELTAQRARVQQMIDEVEVADRALVRARRTHAVMAELVQDEEDKRDEAVADVTKVYQGFVTKEREAIAEADKFDGQIEAVDELLFNLKSVKTECPTCAQHISTAHRLKVIEQSNEEKRKLAFKSDAMRLEAAGYVQQAEAVEYPPEIDRTNLLLAERMLEAAQWEYDTQNARMMEAKSGLEETERKHNDFETRRLTVEKSAITAEQTAKEADEKRESLQEQIKLAEFWSVGFGVGGIRSFLAEAELPHINAAATTYVRRLLGSGATVAIKATKKLKSKDVTREKMDVIATIPGLTKSYAGASTGQKSRLDISLILAMGDVAASRAACPFDCRMIDELFDHLDTAGIDAVADLLRDLAKDRPVVLITHLDALKGVADRVLTVIHDGNPKGGKAIVQEGRLALTNGQATTAKAKKLRKGVSDGYTRSTVVSLKKATTCR